MTYKSFMLFIETPIFTKQASGGLFTDEELIHLQKELITDPHKGVLIQGSGGLRKIRLAGKGTGKSGSYRIIYYRMTEAAIFLLLAYPKTKKDTLSKTELSALKQLIEN